jgi:c-di-GMP-binding flagellar brake protein YcgR
MAKRAVRIEFSKSRFSVAYKFIAREKRDFGDRVYTGDIIDLSSGGMQFLGIIPSEIVFQLGKNEILLGCNILTKVDKFKLLGDIRWLASVGKNDDKEIQYRVGVQFISIDDENKKKLQSFLIKSQIKTNRLYRSGEMLLNPKYVGDIQ